MHFLIIYLNILSIDLLSKTVSHTLLPRRVNYFPTFSLGLQLATIFNIQLLFPMIATRQGLNDIKEAIHKESIILETEGVAVNKSIPMGIMVEIPNVALMPELFVDDVDFFWFGTNNLAQYMMAADRTNTSVANYLPKAIPGILKLIEKVTEIAHDRGKWVGICVGLAADTNLYWVWC